MIRIHSLCFVVLLALLSTAGEPPEALGGPFRFLRRCRRPVSQVYCQVRPPPPTEREALVCPGACIMELWDIGTEPAVCISATYESMLCSSSEGGWVSGECGLLPGSCGSVGDPNCFNVPEEPIGSKRHVSKKGLLAKYGPKPGKDDLRLKKDGFDQETIGYVRFKAKNAGGTEQDRFARLYWVWPIGKKDDGFGFGVQLKDDPGDTELKTEKKAKKHYATVKAEVSIGGTKKKKTFLVRFKDEAMPD